MQRVLRIAAPWVACAGLVACGAGEPADQPAGNGTPVLFVSIDTLAARHLELYGYDRATAPNLTAFAEEAIVFERAQANSPWTVPSYLAQFSGLYPSAHAHDVEDDADLPAWERHSLAPSRETLAERLLRAGYRTAGFFENPWLGIAPFGFGAGFEVWEGQAEGVRAGLGGRLSGANAWLNTVGEDEPWFLFLQSTEPHAPYEPPARFRDAFRVGPDVAPPDLRPVATAEGHSFGAVPAAVARGVAPDGRLPRELDATALQAAYDAEILAMDATFGALLEALRRRDLLDRAIVVISADHGESMVQHDFLFGHGVHYEENLHVPLLIRLPRGEGRGRRVDAPAQLVDLMPTLLELLELSAPSELHGRSLAPILRGRDPAEPTALFAEGGVQEQSSIVLDGFKLIESRPWSAPVSALASHPALTGAARAEVAAAAPEDRATLVRQHLGATPRVELYDLRADPDELVDLADSPEHAERRARLLAALAEARAEAARARAAAGPRDGAVDPETLAELERIGYAGGGGH